MKRIYILFLVPFWFLVSCQSGSNDNSEAETSAPIETTADTDNNKIYELRTYYASDGKLDDLLARFRNHTIALFDKHGMENMPMFVRR